MKKLLIFFFLLVLNFSVKAQYPVTQFLGGDSTLIYIKGAARSIGGFINGVYTDTTAANLTRIRQYQAAQIFTTSDSAMWYRLPGATRWNRMNSSGGGSVTTDTFYWRTGGNYISDTGGYRGIIGTINNQPLIFGTNNQKRVILPASGLLNSGNTNKGFMMYDTTTGAWSYSTGGSGVYTAGNGLTLSGSQFKLGGTLSENTNIVVDNGFRMGFDLDPSDAIFSVSTNNSDTVLKIVNDNRIYLPQIFTVSSTTGRKVALIDTTTGKVERIDPASLVSTPTLQQVITAGSTLTTDNTIGGGGNTLNINNLWGLYIETGNGRGIVMDDEDGQPYLVKIYQTVNSANESAVELSESSVVLRTLKDLRENDLFVKNDSIFFRPSLGQMNIDSLRTWSGISDTTHKKPMTWDTRNGRWEYANSWFGGGGGSTVAVTNGFFEDTLKIAGVTSSIIDRATYRENFIATAVTSGQGVYFSKYVASGGAYGSLDQGTFTPPNLSSGVLGYGLSSSGEIYYTNNSSFRNYLAFETGKTYYLSGRFRIDDLSDATNNYRWYFGWIPGAQDTTGANKAYFYYNHDKYGGQWVCYSSDGTATQATASGTAVAADTWYELTMEVIPGTSTKFYINGSLVATNSTRTPAVATGTWSPAFGVSKTAGSTNRNFFADYVFYRIKD